MSTKFNYRWAVISDQLVGEYAVVTQHGFEVDVAMRDRGTIVQGERRDWVIDTGGGGVATQYTTSIEAAVPRGHHGMRFV